MASGMWGEGFGAIADRRRSKDEKKEAKAATERQEQRIASVDWEPEYVSQHAPQFQRTESPVARSYLESFLMGSNPDAVQGTRAGAKFAKADAQRAFNQQTGGWDALRRRQQELMSDPDKFAIKPITREVASDQERLAMKHPGLAGSGLAESQIEKLLQLNQPGVDIRYNKATGQIEFGAKGFPGLTAAGMTPEEFQRKWEEQYGPIPEDEGRVP